TAQACRNSSTRCCPRPGTWPGLRPPAVEVRQPAVGARQRPARPPGPRRRSRGAGSSTGERTTASSPLRPTRPSLEEAGGGSVRAAPGTRSASTAHPCRRAVSAVAGSGTRNALRPSGRRAARWGRRASARRRRGRPAPAALNAFPVPDGHPGTNMYPPLRSAYLPVEQLTGPVTLPPVVGALADGAGRGARGNSGLILAVAPQGVADALAWATGATADATATARETASDRARGAVPRPVDGTMLTVLS